MNAEIGLLANRLQPRCYHLYCTRSAVENDLGSMAGAFLGPCLSTLVRSVTQVVPHEEAPSSLFTAPFSMSPIPLPPLGSSPLWFYCTVTFTPPPPLPRHYGSFTKMIIVNIQGNGAYHLPQGGISAPVNATTIRDFVEAYKSGALERFQLSRGKG